MIAIVSKPRSWNLARPKRKLGPEAEKARIKIRSEKRGETKRGELIENKRFREMADSRTSMISKT
jgi:hypothetical protein